MKKVVLVFGLISGLISSTMMFITMPFVKDGTIHDETGYIVGYTSIFLSFLLVFFGIRRYRENAGGNESDLHRADDVRPDAVIHRTLRSTAPEPP